MGICLYERTEHREEVGDSSFPQALVEPLPGTQHCRRHPVWSLPCSRRCPGRELIKYPLKMVGGTMKMIPEGEFQVRKGRKA